MFEGTATRASEINNETAYALQRWNFEVPKPFEEIQAGREVVIVDHNQLKQSPPTLDQSMLRGVIDHHAIQGGTVSTSIPIYVDIRPWGSACTIVAHMFFRARRKMNRNTAGLLLSGLISDTLNLRSPTTTHHDRLACSILARFAKVDDVDELAKELFKAKSQELILCSPTQLVKGDLKTFEFKSKKSGKIISLAFGVIEVGYIVILYIYIYMCCI